MQKRGAKLSDNTAFCTKCGCKVIRASGKIPQKAVETLLGEFGGVSEQVNSVLGPGKTFMRSAKAFFKGFTDPKALITAAVVAVHLRSELYLKTAER